jgi:hypothetical protein
LGQPPVRLKESGQTDSFKVDMRGRQSALLQLDPADGMGAVGLPHHGIHLFLALEVRHDCYRELTSVEKGNSINPSDVNLNPP